MERGERWSKREERGGVEWSGVGGCFKRTGECFSVSLSGRTTRL